MKMKTKMLKILALVLAMIMILGTLSSCDSRTIGPAGAQGEKGEKGDQGEQGPQGEQGKQGLSGITPQFKVGEDNYWYASYDNGITWANLNVKATGADGEQGPQGETGATGPQGPSGITPQLKVGEDNYWYASYDNGITWANLNVKATGADGAQGEKGDKGDQGIQGEKGAEGRGVLKVEIVDGYLWITYSDAPDTPVNVGQIREENESHTFGEWKIHNTFESDCEKKLYYRVCSHCNGIEWEEGKYEDHSWNTVTTQPTCQAGGYDTKTCTACGKIELCNETPIAPMNHSFGDWYVIEDASHTTEGLKVRDCPCGKQEHKVLNRIPNLTICEVVTTQNDVTFSLVETDDENFGTIEKISIFRNQELVVETDNIDTRTFNNLSSNTKYTLEVMYSYMYDGILVEKTIQKDFATLPKTVQITDITLSSNVVLIGNSVTLTVKIETPDDITVKGFILNDTFVSAIQFADCYLVNYTSSKNGGIEKINCSGIVYELKNAETYTQSATYSASSELTVLSVSIAQNSWDQEKYEYFVDDKITLTLKIDNPANVTIETIRFYNCNGYYYYYDQSVPTVTKTLTHISGNTYTCDLPNDRPNGIVYEIAGINFSYEGKTYFQSITNESLINYYVLPKVDETEWIDISSVEDLIGISNNPYANYRLVSDIDLAGINWVPIPEFFGVLYGNGYEIKNLKIQMINSVDSPLSSSDIGFFATCNGLVYELVLKNANISVYNSDSSRTMYVGSIAGGSKGSMGGADYYASYPTAKFYRCFIECNFSVVGGKVDPFVSHLYNLPMANLQHVDVIGCLYVGTSTSSYQSVYGIGAEYNEKYNFGALNVLFSSTQLYDYYVGDLRRNTYNLYADYVASDWTDFLNSNYVREHDAI